MFLLYRWLNSIVISKLLYPWYRITSFNNTVQVETTSKQLRWSRDIYIFLFFGYCMSISKTWNNQNEKNQAAQPSNWQVLAATVCTQNWAHRLPSQRWIIPFHSHQASSQSDRLSRLHPNKVYIPQVTVPLCYCWLVLAQIQLLHI